MTDTAQQPSSPSIDPPLPNNDSEPAVSYNQGLTPLHPPHKSLIRVRMAIRALFLVIAALVADFFAQDRLGIPGGYLVGTALVLAGLMILVLPNRIYRRWGYDMGAEQLRVLRGFLWRQTPLSRSTGSSISMSRRVHCNVFMVCRR